jgi:hypothetical protein
MPEMKASLMEPLRRFAEAIRLTLLIYEAEREGVRLVIYCVRPRQLHTLLAQLLMETNPADAMQKPNLHEDRTFGWHGVRVELREEDGR